MQGGLRRAGAAARQGNREPGCGRICALLCSVVVVVLSGAGCAPPYYDADPVMSEAAPAGPRPQSRAKMRVSLPNPDLTKPQAPPDCGETTVPERQPARDPKQVTTTSVVTEQASPVNLQPVPGPEQTDRNEELALRIKLEYERECYRQAEARVRERLRQLQVSVGETAKSVSRMEQQGR